MIRCIPVDATTPDQLEEAVLSHMRSYKHLFGTENMIPKFHMALHLIDQYRKHGKLPNCWALERKHKNVKKFANNVQNTKCDFEAYVLREVTVQHLGVLSMNDEAHFGTESCLVHATPPNASLLQMLQRIFGNDCEFGYSICARINQYETCSKDDVVMLQAYHGILVAKVRFHIRVTHPHSLQRDVLSCVHLWDEVSSHNRFSKWQVSDEHPHLCRTSDIKWACIWTAANSVATVLHPTNF